MQLSLNKYRIGAFVSALLFLAALPSQAQFGGVVFDPTQSAHALQQIEQNIQNSVTWQQQLANTIQLLATADKDYQQAITTYNMIHGNLQNFSSKSIWRTIQSQLTMASFANQYGETTGLQSAMNGQAPGTASMVWKLMNLGLNSTSSSFLSSQVLGTSHALATLTRMEAMDGVSSQCLTLSGITTGSGITICNPKARSPNRSLIPLPLPPPNLNSSTSSTWETRTI